MDRKALISEQAEIESRLQKSEFPRPVDLRRLDEIRSLLLTDGKSADVAITIGPAKQSSFVVRSMSSVANKRRRK